MTDIKLMVDVLSELNLVFLTKIKCGIFAYITFFLYLCI